MVATRNYTVEEVERNPPDGSWELIDGEIIQMTPSGSESSSIALEIAGLVVPYVRKGTLGRCFGADSGFAPIPGEAIVRSPDFAFVRAERLPDGKPPAGFMHFAPDFAVEVLSPSDSRPAAIAKCAWWLEAGSRLVWMVDPARRSVTVFSPDGDLATFTTPAMLDLAPVLPGLRIAVDDIFA
ncbi:MAG: Uma2 family endonuclease [Thermomicrobiales bacterium]